jgi:hypothetical protein
MRDMKTKVQEQTRGNSALRDERSPMSPTTPNIRSEAECLRDSVLRLKALVSSVVEETESLETGESPGKPYRSGLDGVLSDAREAVAETIGMVDQFRVYLLG